jgi:hypothetical protein
MNRNGNRSMVVRGSFGTMARTIQTTIRLFPRASGLMTLFIAVSLNHDRGTHPMKTRMTQIAEGPKKC